MPDLTIPDVERRLPTIELIERPSIRAAVAETVIDHGRPYFWNAPAASSYTHHNPYCCGDRGLWIHTLMVCTAYERLVPSYTVSGRISAYDADCGRAACLLHDFRKYGIGYYDGKHANDDHDLEAAAIAEEHPNLGVAVSEAIASHMGPFDGYDGPAPESDLEMLVHQADMAASTKNGMWGIYNPPEEIVELYPSLPQADL